MVSFDTNISSTPPFRPPSRRHTGRAISSYGECGRGRASCCFKLAEISSENNFSPVASRHVIVRQARFDKLNASFLTEAGLCLSSRRSSFGGRP